MPCKYTFGGFSLDPARRRLSRPDGAPIVLSARAFDVLVHLVEHRGRHVGKARLIAAVWPGVVVEENNLTQAIHMVRRALGDTRADARFIATIPGRGYSFVADVTEIAETAAPPPRLEAARGISSRPRRAWVVGAFLAIATALTLHSDAGLNGLVAATLHRQSAETGPVAPTNDPAAYASFLKATLARENLLGTSTNLDVIRQIQAGLDDAIRRDPSFAIAYAERSLAWTDAFRFNVDASPVALAKARSDLETAARLSPDDPRVLEARAHYEVASGGDVRTALALVESADVGERADGRWLVLKSMLLEMAGRSHEAQVTRQRALTLEPRNPATMIGHALMLERLHKPGEALQILDFGAEHLPERQAALLRMVRGSVVFGATGDNREWLDAVRALRGGPAISATAAIETQFVRLRLANRLEELAQLLDQAPPVIRSALNGVGELPTAVLRGWLCVLMRDRAAAATQGRQVLQFLAHSEENAWNVHYLRLLAAQAATFVGDSVQAVEAARAALEYMPRTRDAFAWMQVAAAAAPVLAWNGAEDDAVELLTQLATATPGLPPAYIARDPLLTVPLETNTTYQNLVAQLEADMSRFAASGN